MEEEDVKNSLIELLRIPITQVVITTNYVEMWLNNDHIGNVPFTINSFSLTPTFDTEETQVLTRLNWPIVLKHWHNEIREEIIEKYNGLYDPILTTSGDFGIVYLKKNEKDIAPLRVRAIYDGTNWSLYEE